jgi:flagellar L-ring protein precursor FlgH
MNLIKLATILTLTATLGACSTMDRLANVGQAPALTAIADPTTTAGYQPVRMPMPEPIADTYQSNSLYRTSARGFFKDERAHRIGDILTVKVTIDDSAQINNQTQRNRTSTNSAGMGGIFAAGFSNVAGPSIDPSAAIDFNSGMRDTGNGSVNALNRWKPPSPPWSPQVLPMAISSSRADRKCGSISKCAT